jgi:Holliday junction resolvase RusA-like endonuclease
MSGPRSWTIELPAGMDLLNANQRYHWRVRAERTKHIRSTAEILARGAKIPTLARAHIIGEFRPPNRRRRDVANLYPSFKAAIDGLVDAGVLEDDDDTHLVGPDMRLGPVRLGQIVLHITELLEES